MWTIEKMKKEIDTLTYFQMLRLYRTASSSHPFFHGELLEYFLERMQEKRDVTPVSERIIANRVAI